MPLLTLAVEYEPPSQDSGVDVPVQITVDFDRVMGRRHVRLAGASYHTFMPNAALNNPPNWEGEVLAPSRLSFKQAQRNNVSTDETVCRFNSKTGSKDGNPDVGFPIHWTDREIDQHYSLGTFGQCTTPLDLGFMTWGRQLHIDFYPNLRINFLFGGVQSKIMFLIYIEYSERQ